MVHPNEHTGADQLSLSVLALSSRFDGRRAYGIEIVEYDFQYSLCRVVLMVALPTLPCIAL